MDPQRLGRLGQPGLVEQRPERREVLTLDVGPAREERLEERAG
jgi:hypothetical protein